MWDDKQFNYWLGLREEYRIAKAEKNYKRVIGACNAILKLSKKAEFIGIIDAIFEYEIGKSFEKLELINNALTFYKKALQSYTNLYEQTKQEGWLTDIKKIDKKIIKLSKLLDK